MVRLLSIIISAEDSVIVFPLVDASNVMVDPGEAEAITSRRDPGPLSAVEVTTWAVMPVLKHSSKQKETMPPK